jgi:hypothetical protein
MKAADIGGALGGRRCGDRWMCRCPAHADHTPSLAIRDGNKGVLVKCFAGCSSADVIATLRGLGLWQSSGFVIEPVRFVPPVGDAERTAYAVDVWRRAAPAGSTMVEVYLRASRGIRLCPPASLRFANLRHPDGERWPAMVALVQDGLTGRPVAAHRTFLARSGVGKAPVSQAKMMLGPCAGGAVRLAALRADAPLLVGEGIETTLSAMQATGFPGWAALSTSGMRGLTLPSDVRDVIVLADGDEAGAAAAHDCGLRWRREGRRVRIACPPRGMDFNDMLPGRAHRTREHTE